MKFFEMNEGTADRVVRVVLGLGALSLVVVGPQTMWGLLGFVPLATGAFGSCPAYTLLGINTCGMKRGEEPSPAAVERLDSL